jgi:hypothetical protein
VAQHPPGPRRRELSVSDDRGAIHEHPIDADRVLMWLRERSLVLDGRWIEDGDVREAPGPNAAAIRQTEPLRGHACHLVHGLLEREHMLNSHIFAEHAREGAVVAWVGHAFAGS